MDEKIIRIQKHPEEWRESYHYGLYNHRLITKDGLTYTTIADTETTATSNLSYLERDRILNPGFYSGARSQVIFKPSES